MSNYYHYSTLKISPSATQEEIIKSFQKQQADYGQKFSGKELIDRQKELFLAYQVLHDPLARKIYDQKLLIAYQTQQVLLAALQQAYLVTNEKIKTVVIGSDKWLSLILNKIDLLQKAQKTTWEIDIIRTGIPYQNKKALELQKKLITIQIECQKQLINFPSFFSQETLKQLEQEQKTINHYLLLLNSENSLNVVNDALVIKDIVNQTEFNYSSPVFSTKQKHFLRMGSISLLTFLGFFFFGMIFLTIGKNLSPKESIPPQIIATTTILENTNNAQKENIIPYNYGNNSIIAKTETSPELQSTQNEKFSGEVISYTFIDPKLLPAFELVLNDPQTGELALTAIKHKLPLRITNQIQEHCEVEQEVLACFLGGIGRSTGDNQIWVGEEILKKSNVSAAAILAHELTHAQQFYNLDISAVAEQKTCSLSQEFDAHRNQILFMQRHGEEDSLVRYTTYEGQFDEFLLYRYLQNAYLEQCVDDLLWKPTREYPPSTITFFPDCLSWERINNQDVGEEKCIFGIIDHVKTSNNKEQQNNQTIYFSPDENDLQIVFSSPDKYLKIEKGECILIRSVVLLDNQKLLVMADENNRPQKCETK